MINMHQLKNVNFLLYDCFVCDSQYTTSSNIYMLLLIYTPHTHTVTGSVFISRHLVHTYIYTVYIGRFIDLSM